MIREVISDTFRPDVAVLFDYNRFGHSVPTTATRMKSTIYRIGHARMLQANRHHQMRRLGDLGHVKRSC
jgi:hypothetical protein